MKSSFPESPRTHPSEDQLAALVAGQLDLPARVVLECHLAYCSSCCELIAELASVGARYLDQLAERQPPLEVWKKVQAALDASMEGATTLPDPCGLDSLPLPPSARSELFGSGAVSTREVERYAWRHLPFSRARSLRLVPRGPSGAELLVAEVPAGVTLPRHEHLGVEEIVVLQGSYRDHQGHFGLGDYQEYPAGSTHAPKVQSDRAGWVVARLEGRVRFTGWRGLAVNLARRLYAMRRPSSK